ncbi:hypothetical protein ON010_g1826 [Phytophthora cinnamomi]|nr:hypothetical protein ON010_g1826 [Phytophthora cinnamomi]
MLTLSSRTRSEPPCFCVRRLRGKLPPLVVFKGEPGYHVQAELERLPAHRSDKVVLTMQANTYCDQHVMEEWIQEVRVEAIGLWPISAAARQLEVPQDGFNASIARSLLYGTLITDIVVAAWESVPVEVIRRGFVKAGLIPVGPRSDTGAFVIDKTD